MSTSGQPTELQPLHTIDDLAAMLKRTRRATLDAVNREGWAHVRIGKSVRFTDAQVAQIIASHTVRNEPAEFEGSGLTARSARRSA